MNVIITGEAHQILVDAGDAFSNFVDTSERLDDGRYLIEMGEDTYRRLVNLKLSAERLSDAIVRTGRVFLGRLPS